MKHIKIVNTIDDAKDLVAKSLIYDNIHKQNINWLQQPDQGEVFSINEGADGNLMPDMFKISITYHNINSSLTYDLGFGDALDILKVALNGREINKSTLTSFVFDNDGDNVLDIYINKDPNNESVDIHWSNVSPAIDPVTVYINKYISNIPKLSANIKEVICDAPTIKINAGIFGSTNIESFKYDGVIKYIGDNGFRGCKNLKSIELKDGLQYIGNSAFDSSGLTQLTLPNSLTSIKSGAFSGCSGLTQLTLPNSLTSIGDSAFAGCTNVIIHVPETIETIGYAAFGGVKKVILKNYTRFDNWQSWYATEIVEE